MSDDLDERSDSPSVSPKRIDKINCLTCRERGLETLLGVKLPYGQVSWLVTPVIVDYANRSSSVLCPVCSSERTWKR